MQINKIPVREFIEKYTYMGEFKSDFKINSGMEKMIECYEDKINSIAYIPRQNLRTVTLCMLYLYTKIFEPEVKAIFIGHDDKFIQNRITSIVDNLPNLYRALMMKNITKKKTKKYVFIDDFEFINDSALDNLSSSDFIMANSTINDNISPKALDLLNDSNVFNITIKVNPEEFGETYMQGMKIMLLNDEDVYRREVLLQRK